MWSTAFLPKQNMKQYSIGQQSERLNLSSAVPFI